MAAREEFLNGKLIVIGEENLQLSKEVFVNFCTPNIFSGSDILREIHEIAGSLLEKECRRFCGLGSGCCRLTDAFDAKQFKKIAHCILPAPKPVERQDECDYVDFAMAYRSALDMTLEAGCKSIVFTHPQFYSHKLIAAIAVGTIRRWLSVANHTSEMDEISIMCNSSEIVQLYSDTIAQNESSEELMDEVFSDTIERPQMPDFSEAVNVRLFESLMQAPEFDASFDNPIYYNGNNYPTTNQYCMEKYGFDENYIRHNAEKLYEELFKTPDGLQLQLSRNLSATILTIEEENGFLRQYRMTTQSREGDTCYFRCSRCESLMKQTNSEYRPKITVKAGFIFGDCYPEHHPQCEPLTKEMVIFQQMDREARLSMMKPMPGEYSEYYDYANQARQDYYGSGYMSEYGMPEFSHYQIPPYKQEVYARPKIRGFVDNAGYYYENPQPKVRSVLGGSSINNTLQAIRKCETELDQDYLGAGDGRIRDEDFTRAMVGDLQHSNFLQDEYGEKVNDENELRADMAESEVHNKVTDAEMSDADAAIAGGDGYDTSRKLLAEDNTEDNLPNAVMMEDDYQFPRVSNAMSNPLAYRIPSYLEQDEYGVEFSAEAPELTEEQLVAKCRKYRIIRERRRTNVAFDWRDEADVKPPRIPSTNVTSKRSGILRGVGPQKVISDDSGKKLSPETEEEDSGHKYVYEDELDELLETSARRVGRR